MYGYGRHRHLLERRSYAPFARHCSFSRTATLASSNRVPLLKAWLSHKSKALEISPTEDGGRDGDPTDARRIILGGTPVVGQTDTNGRRRGLMRQPQAIAIATGQRRARSGFIPCERGQRWCTRVAV